MITTKIQPEQEHFAQIVARYEKLRSQMRESTRQAELLFQGGGVCPEFHRRAVGEFWLRTSSRRFSKDTRVFKLIYLAEYVKMFIDKITFWTI